MANAKIVEWEKPYTWGTAIEVDNVNKIISLLLRAENNLLHVNSDNELYCDLQIANGITPTDSFEVWVTTWIVNANDGRDQNGLLLHYETTSGAYAQWLYWADGKLYFDGWTWTWKQVYYAEEVDTLIQNLRTYVDQQLALKADKVANATNWHLAGLDANGNLTDSGIVASNVWDMKYSDFNFSEQTSQWNANITLELSTTLSPTANFTVNPPVTIKDGQIYILRIKNWSPVYTMTLNSVIDNPHNVDLTLTENAEDMFVFLAIWNKLELQPALPEIPTKLSEFTNDEWFITNTVNNLTNYYLKTETYTKAEVDAAIASAAWWLTIQVVQTLPQAGQNGVIYLVPNSGSWTNIYDEYIWVSSTSTFEKIGTTEIDLSNYYTKTQVDTLLNGKQDTLVSWTNIKTINSISLLGSGDIPIQWAGWDVTWPNSSIDWHLAVFDWATGKVLKDGWVVPVESNTKTFYVSSSLDLLPAQAAYDWYLAGKNPIINYTNKVYIFDSVSSNNVVFYSADNIVFTAENTVNPQWRSFLWKGKLVLKKTWDTITEVVIMWEDIFGAILPDIDYQNPYIPQYDGSPATKKYVDDSVAASKSTWSTAPSNPSAWQMWYDTTNNVLKVYDWTQWNEVWWEECNTKIFTLSSTSDITTAKAIRNYYNSENKIPLVKYDNYIYILASYKSWTLQWTREMRLSCVGKTNYWWIIPPNDNPAITREILIISVYDWTPDPTPTITVTEDGIGDINYSDFTTQSATSGATLTISNLTTQFVPTVDFTVSTWTVKEWMQYVLRINSGATAYNITLWTGITNPFSEDLTLTASKMTTIVLLATSSSTLEVFSVRTAD